MAQTILLRMLLWSGHPILAMLLGLSAQQANRQVIPGTEIPSTGAEYTFQHVVGMDIGPDGSVLILDPTEKAVLRFGPRGEYRGRLGKEGAGPGEFRWPMQVGILKDEIWVLDMQLWRINVFDKDQSPLRTQRLEKSGLVSLLEGGAMVVQPIAALPPPGARVDTATVALHLIQADGSQDRVASWLIDPNQVTVNSPGFTAVARQPLVDAPLWDVTRDGRSVVFIQGGDMGSPSLVAVSPTGQTMFRRPIPWPRVPVTTALYDRTVDSLVKYFERSRPANVSATPVDRNAIRRAVRRPRDLSAVTRILTGTDGRIWLRRRMTTNSEWVEWHSFRADGTPESSALVPAAAVVHVFTNRTLWGVIQGEDDEPRVVEYVLPPSLQRQ